MVEKINISPTEVRGYGNIIIPKITSDFKGNYTVLSTASDGSFVLEYQGYILKITSSVSDGIVGYNTTLDVNVLLALDNTPVEDVTVVCTVDGTSIGSETTDSNGDCSFTWVPDEVGEVTVTLSITSQGDYADTTSERTVTIGLLLNILKIMTYWSNNNGVYNSTYEAPATTRSVLDPFVKDVYVSTGGEYIVDSDGIIHLCEPGDLVVAYESLEQSSEYSNVLFEDDVTLLTGAVVEAEVNSDNELVLTRLERSDIVVESGVNVLLSASPSSTTYGTSVVLSASVTEDGEPVSGESVSFYEGETSLGTASTNSSGVATLTLSALSVGSHSVKAVYDETISNTVSVTIGKVTPSITISVPSTGTVGTSYTVSGTLSVDGSVKLYEGSSLKDTLTVSSGSFSKSITQSSEGTYSYYAVFEATSTHNSVTSSTASIVVSDVPTPTPASMTLTSDKSVLSYYDSESATLTATVLDSNSQGVSGETVEFFAGSTSLGTATTNSSGVATKTYSSTGAGDVTLSAECRLLIQTYVIEDCLYYDAQTTDKNRYSVTSGTANVTYSNDGLTVKGTANSIALVENTALTLPSEYEASVKITGKQGAGGSGTQYYGGFVFDDLLIDFKGTSKGITLYQYSTTSQLTEMTYTLQLNDVIKVRRENGNMKFYVNDTLKYTANSISSTTTFLHRTYNNRSLTCKDLKIKPL